MQALVVGVVRLLLATQATQATQASLTGVVRDGETGAPIVGAVVALTDLDRAGTTDAAGRYVLTEVPAGPQHLSVHFIGYTPRTLHALVPREGRLELDITLRAEPLHLPTLEVRPPVALRGLDAADSNAYPDRSSSIAAVWNHPLLAEPDALQALSGGEVVLKAESPSGLHIRGGAADQTAYLLDGIPVFSPYHAAGMFSAWNPDALASLQLTASIPAPERPVALSGLVAAFTRAPGSRFRAQGGTSSTQARITADGPIGARGAGFLVSVRSGFPGSLAPEEESSYLRGETADWLAKVELPAVGGRLRLLAYDSSNEIDAAARAVSDSESVDPRRNAFEWHSRSVGAEWKWVGARTRVRVIGWSAVSDASAAWNAHDTVVTLAADRSDMGAVGVVERSATNGTTTAGVRAEWSTTAYAIASERMMHGGWERNGRTPVATLFAQHARKLGRRLELTAGASLTRGGGELRLAPHTGLRWKASERLTFSGSYVRRHQFAQSLRNPESIVGSIFPADLYLGAGIPGVPTGRSDQGLIAAEYRPAVGMRLGIQGYARRLEGLLLVAPRAGEPFSTGEFATGSGVSRGVSLDAALTGSRLGLLASYGLQHVRFDGGGISYVPDHGATHLLEAGVIVFPSATSSLRLGVTSELGRRTTTASGGLEWEACNLLDRGCEFGGSPQYGGETLGGTALPGYLRIDVGFRKHWHVELAGRDATVALFGTVTNLFGRRNLLTNVRDPATGELTAIEMRPLTPLVVGLDWRF